MEDKPKYKKYYKDLTVEQKRKLRSHLEHTVELKKKQLDIFEKNFIKPIKEQIKLVEQVKKNEIPFEHYIRRNQEWSKWLIKFMSGVSKGIEMG